MFDGVSDGARDRPPLPVKWGGGAAEPSGMLVTSAQRVSFLVGSFLQLPHRGPAPSGSPCWAAVRRMGGGCRLLSVPTPHPLPLWLAACPLHPGMSPFVCHLLTSYVLPQCAGVWCAVWCVCGWVSPECAAVAQCPRVRASFAVYQCLREFTLRSFIRSLGSRLPIFAYVLMVDTTRCMLSPPSPAPLASPLTPPWWVCVRSRV
jgi:hypothetical protein